MLKVKDLMDDILYRDEGAPYLSAVPLLMYCSLRERFYKFLGRLFKN